jgi:hypothetical protein
MQSRLAQAGWNVSDHIPPELVAPFDFMRGDYVQALPHGGLELRVSLDEFHSVIPGYELDPTTPIEYICGVKSRPSAWPLVYPSSAS